MPNVDRLEKYLKVDMVREGSIIKFIDSGKIVEKEFEEKDKTKKLTEALEIEVMIEDTEQIKIYSPNKTSRTNLKAAWGSNTEDWIGKRAKITLYNILVSGVKKQTIVAEPVE